MRKLISRALPLLVGAAALSSPSPASAAGTITVDQTIQQQCSFQRSYSSDDQASFSLPIRLQFTVPDALRSGEPLVIDQRRVSLPAPSALYRAVQAAAPEGGLEASVYGGGQFRGANLSVTGVASPIRVAPDISVRWPANDSGPSVIEGPSGGGFAAALNGIDVPSGDVAVAYTGYDADISLGREDYFYAYELNCEPSAPVVLATVAVSPEVGPPAVEALSDLQSPLAGGTTIRLQGRNFTGADAVSFGGTPAASFEVVSDGTIDAKVPARAAGTDLQISVSRGSEASADTVADDFDFVAAPSAGSFDTLLSLTCTDSYITPRTFDVGLRLRGKVPSNVQPGATFAVSDLHATVLFDGTAMGFGRPEPRFAGGYLTPVKVALQGATATGSALGDGYLRSTDRRVQFGQPVAFEGAFDKPWATPQPPNTITAAAPAGGEVVVSFADARPIVFADYGGGGYAGGPQMQSCALAAGSGSGVIARIPVGTAPVDQKPVVTKVSGGIFAGLGGLVTITGQRLAGGSVRIGGRAATKLATVGNTLYVWAPALGAGTYDVVVTTSKGASAVTPASKLRYARLF